MREEISTLGYAVLSVLARESLSGYDISLRMQMPIGYFWSSHRSHIYPELARLRRRGLVTFDRVEQEDRPDKKVYSITEAGKEALGAWIPQPPAVAPNRSELVLKVFSFWLADLERVIELFREQERHHAQLLARHEAQLTRNLAECAVDRLDGPDLGNYLALQRGIGYEREYTAWCRLVIGELERWHARSKSI